MASNPYYQRVFSALALSLARVQTLINEFTLIQQGFDRIGVVTNATKYQLACSDLGSDLKVGLDVAYFRVQRAITITAVRASLIEASASGVVQIGITVNGAPMLSTNLFIDALELTSTTAVTPAVILTPALPDDAEIRISILQAGSAARGLIVSMLGTVSG